MSAPARRIGFTIPPIPIACGQMDGGIKERLDEFIRRKGLRRTVQREQIVAEVFSRD